MPEMEPVRCSASLRAVLQSHEVAALLDHDARALLKRVRAGKVPEAIRSFDRKGYVFDVRDVERMIEVRWPEAADRERALRDLLGIRAGSLRSLHGAVIPVTRHPWEETAPRANPADDLLEHELRELVARAGTSARSREEFDAWAAVHADGLTHVDVMIRLSWASWEQVSPPAPSEAGDAEPGDLRDPLSALRLAAEHFGKPPSYGRFDRWALAAGCPHRAGGIRSRFGGWNAALREAGLID
jgi:hypothetical protein